MAKSLFRRSPGFLTSSQLVVDARGRGAAWALLSSFWEADPETIAKIAGTASIAIGGSGNLGGLGELTGAAAVAFGADGAAGGVGVLAGAAEVALGATGNVSADGALAGAASVAISAGGDLSAEGALVGTAALDVSAVGAIEGVASLAGTVVLLLDAAGGLTAVVEVSAPGMCAVTIAPAAEVLMDVSRAAVVVLDMAPSAEVVLDAEMAAEVALDVSQAAEVTVSAADTQHGVWRTMSTQYPLGQQLLLKLQYRSLATADKPLRDPGEAKVHILRPDGTRATLTYSDGAGAITRLEEGVYLLALDLTVSGPWTVKALGTAPVVCATPDLGFTVPESAFA